jgi:hypothetical protein
MMPVALGSTVHPCTGVKDLTSRCACMYTKFIHWECKKICKTILNQHAVPRYEFETRVFHSCGDRVDTNQ